MPSAQARTSNDTTPTANAQNYTASLNGTWRFRLAADAAEAERLARFYEAAFDADRFEPLVVPSNWALHGFEEPLFTQWYTNAKGEPVLPEPSAAEGLYLRRFRAPADSVGARTLLHFGGVWQTAEVWLNGRRIGQHEGGFTSFAFDVSEHLEPAAENVLAVRVRQRTREAMLDVNDDWALGGIYRDVWLETMPAGAYIDRVEAVIDFDDEYRDADLNLRVFIGRQARGAPAHSGKHQLYRARVTLTDKQGREVARAERTGAVGLCGFVVCGQEERISLPVSAPLRWTAETPNLYDLRVELFVDDRVVHTRTERIGFREVSTKGGVLRVNGAPVKLRGVARHDEHPEVGRAMTRALELEDIRLMKAANINAVRTTHYPPSEDFIELCDELGLYVIEEVPMGFGGDLLLDPSFAASVVTRAHETLKRDRNRASIIIWSIGNEDPLTDLHLAAIRYVKGADPTRPVLMPWNADESLPPEIDILAPHYRTAEAYDRLAAAARRPVITTEYTHALGHADFGGLEDRWTSLTRHAAGAGGMIWAWADQGIKRKTNGRPVLDPLADMGRYGARGSELVRHSDAGAGEIYDAHGVFGSDGIVDPDRTPQRDYWETRSVYAPVKVLADETAFVAGQRRVSIPVRNDYDFTNLSSLDIGWRLMADERRLAAGEAKLTAAPHTTATLDVPTGALAALAALEPGVSYYIALSFRRADGSEIIERSVRLIARDGARTATAATNGGVSVRPRVARRGANVTVGVGGRLYEFSPQTAQLVGAKANDRLLVTGARATVWRPLTIAETVIFRGGDKRSEPVAPDLDRYTTTVRRWNVAEEGDRVRITAEAEHRVDDKNSFTVDYEYTISSDGGLRIAYGIEPRVEIKWLPEIGIEYDLAPSAATLRWAGSGLLDSYPNERAAASFGVWSASVTAAEARGVKLDVRWAEVVYGANAKLRVEGSPYVRLERDGGGTTRLRVLSQAAGRSTKFQRPERSGDRLDIVPGGRFVGEHTLALK